MTHEPSFMSYWSYNNTLPTFTIHYQQDRLGQFPLERSSSIQGYPVLLKGNPPFDWLPASLPHHLRTSRQTELL